MYRRSISWKISLIIFTLILTACRTIDATPGGLRPSGDTAESYNMSIDQIKEAAQAGDVDAQYALGYSYYYGKGVPQDPQTAIFWIRKAAAAGQAQAVKALVLLDKPANPENTVSPSPQPNTQIFKSATTVSGKGSNYASTPPQSPPQRPYPNTEQPVNNITKEHILTTTVKPVLSMEPSPTRNINSVPPQPSAPPQNPPAQTAQPTAEGSPTSSLEYTVAKVSNENAANAAPAPSGTQLTSAQKAQIAQTAQMAQQPVTTDATAVGDSLSLDSLSKAPNHYYTIQLLGASHEAEASSFIKTHSLQGKAVYYHTQRNGGSWYVVVYGLYKSRAEAQQALQQLPEELRGTGAWVNSMSNVHAGMGSA
jgi:DamX protein